MHFQDTAGTIGRDNQQHNPSGLAEAVPVYSELARFPQMRPMLEVYLHGLPRQLDDLSDALEGDDRSAIGPLAERISHQAGVHGFGPISAAAAEVAWWTAQHADLEEARRAIRELTDLCERASSGLFEPLPDDLPPAG